MDLPSFDQLLPFVEQHPLLLVAFVVVLVAIIANEAHGRLSAGPRLAVTDAVRMINDRHPLILDIRSAAEYKKRHILGAINAPAADLKQRGSEFGKDMERPIIIYCNMGTASLEAAKTLRALGYKEVHPLRGGLNGWENNNLPVTTK